jgi:hypothetical protein
MRVVKLSGHHSNRTTNFAKALGRRGRGSQQQQDLPGRLLHPAMKRRQPHCFKARETAREKETVNVLPRQTSRGESGAPTKSLAHKFFLPQISHVKIDAKMVIE